MSYWYCPNCKEELDGCHVTYQELCEYCGTHVLCVEEGISPARLTEILEAERKGRLVVLPIPEESDYEGLKVKYRVYKARNNELVEDCFVLRPDKDPAAVTALTAYAKMTDNKQLSEDILNWITPDEKVVVLPCKVGDTLYVIARCADIIMHYDNDYNNGTGAIECPFEGSCIYRECNDEQSQVLETVCTGFWFDENVHGGIFLEHISSETYISDFGKTVFLTREEAEAALKEAE